MPEQFFKVANELETTFNMAYMDNKNIAYFSTGRLPILAAGTNPSLLTLGKRGIQLARLHLPGSSTRMTSNPASGTVAELERTSRRPNGDRLSGEYYYGPVQRVQLFTGFPKTGKSECGRSRRGS